jgi:hypothetical protein
MARMKKIVRGMIIDIDLDPSSGSETGKVRPCVVVTNNIYNERVPVIQVVPITAWNAKKDQIKTNVELEPSEKNNLSKNPLPTASKPDLWIIGPASSGLGEHWNPKSWKRSTRH